MVPMAMASSVTTTVRPRACPLDHASIHHASRRALTTHDPRMCAGAEFFDILRSVAILHWRPSWWMPTTRGRQRRQRGRRAKLRFVASACSVRGVDHLVTTPARKRCQRPAVTSIASWWPTAVLWLARQPIGTMMVSFGRPYCSPPETYFDPT